MTKNDDKRVPVLRFKGFNDDWAQRELRELANIGDGLHGTPTYIDNSKYFFINGNNLVNDKIRITSETKKISFSQLSKSDKALNNLTLLMSINGTIGQLAFYNGENIKLGKSIAYIIFHSKNNFEFFYGVLKTPNIQRYFQRHVTGTTIKNLGLAELRNFKYPIPSEKEQEKIGKTIILINKIIVLQQRKAKQLKLLKKAMLQMLYTKEYIPSLRFMEFSTKWNLVKLGDVTYRYDNLRQPVIASQRTHGKIPYYGANGIQDHVDGYTHKGKFLLIAEDGANDIHNYPVKYVDGKIWVNNHAHVIQSMPDKVDDIFLLNAIKIINMQPYLVGGSRAKLNADVMNKIPIKLPTLQEQKDIGSLAYHLDKLIKLCLSKNSQLQSAKQFLLQNMFI